MCSISEKVFIVTAFDSFVLSCFGTIFACRARPYLLTPVRASIHRVVVDIIVPLLHAGDTDLSSSSVTVIINWYFRDDHPWCRTVTRLLLSLGLPLALLLRFCLLSRFLSLLLKCQYLLFVLLEADEVKVQILHTVFFKKVLPYKTIQVDASLSQRVVLIQ